MVAIAFLLILGGAGLVWLGWTSVRSLREAILLGSLPKGIAGALVGQRVAVRGQVKILEPMEVPGIGPCLWCRRTEKQLDSLALDLAFGSRRRNWRTISDQSTMATFALLVSGEELAILDLPTETQDTRSRRESDGNNLIDQLFNESYVQEYEWLPVLQEATVVGRLERRDDRRVVVADPELGLLLSPLPPDRAARMELLKAVSGFVGITAGIGGMIWLLNHFTGHA